MVPLGYLDGDAARIVARSDGRSPETSREWPLPNQCSGTRSSGALPAPRWAVSLNNVSTPLPS